MEKLISFLVVIFSLISTSFEKFIPTNPIKYKKMGHFQINRTKLITLNLGGQE